MVNYMRRKFFYLVLSFFILGLILIMATKVRSSNFNNNKLLEDDDKYMASYIDGEYQNEIPGKNDGYIVDKVVCDNGAVATWDNEEWGINIRNAAKKIKCSLYFRLKNDVTVTYDNNYVKNNVFEEYYKTQYINSFPNNNVSINYENYYENGIKKYKLTAQPYESSSWSGCYFGYSQEFIKNTTYYYTFEVRGNTGFYAIINPEQDKYTTYYITNSWKKYHKQFTANGGFSSFVFYNWLSGTDIRTLEIKNLELQEGEYDNYSTISLKETDKLNDTLPTPTRENYTFLGWYTDPIEGDKISGDTVVTKNTTYYAHWQYNEN